MLLCLLKQLCYYVIMSLNSLCYYVLNQQAVAHLDGAVGDTGQTFVMCYYDEGLAVFVAQVKKQLVQFGFILRIQRAARLVSQYDGGTVHQCARHSHTLLLASGELVGLVMGTVAEAHELQ